MKKVTIVLFLIFLSLIESFFTYAVTLVLSPSSGTYASNDILTVNILLDTTGIAIDGVDILYLNYNPSLLEAQDEDFGTSGVQISAGNLLTSTLANSVDTTNGRIQFSQTSSGGTTFTGSGTLATVRFRVVGTGTATVNFDFTQGSTTDTNVASSGSDVLSSVTNGNFNVGSSGGGGGSSAGGGGWSGGGGGSGGGGESGGGGGIGFVCNMDWQCTRWSACTSGWQTRICNFVRVPQHVQNTECPSSSKPPTIGEKCEVIELSKPAQDQKKPMQTILEQEQPILEKKGRLLSKKFLFASSLGLFIIVIVVIIAIYKLKDTNFDKNMPVEVFSYIRKMRQMGKSDADISESLLKVGWDKEDVRIFMKRS